MTTTWDPELDDFTDHDPPPHADHLCRICDVGCLWCDHCGFAHCFNGHEHHGFEGRA